MAAHKGPRYTSDFSYLLEEQIDIPYQIVGYPDWLEKAIPGHLRSIQLPVYRGKEERGMAPVLNHIWAHNILGLDLETGGEKERDGLDPISKTSRILLGQFGNKEKIFVVQPELIRHLKAPLESEDILKINQNIEFDFKWLLHELQIHIVRMYCTMLSEQVLRAGRDGFGVSLLDLARYHACRLISKEVRTEFANHSGVFTEKQLYYSARDIYLLFDIFESQDAEIDELGLGTVTQDEFRVIPAVAEMELVGVNMDTEYLGLSIRYFAKEAVRLKQAIHDTWNAELKKQGKKVSSAAETLFADLFGEAEDEEEEFDIDSAEQKLEALRRIGLTLDNVQRATLKTIEHQMAKLLVEYSLVQKIVSTYGVRLVNMIHPDDGRLHPQWKQLGMGDGESQGSRDKKATIATGRMSGDFMQLPRTRDIYELIDNPEELEMVRRLMPEQIAKAQQKLAEELAKDAAKEAADKLAAAAAQQLLIQEPLVA